MQEEAQRLTEEGLAPNRIRVLVAESNKRTRSVLCWMLEHDGRFRVVGEATTGEEAVACDEPFDVALVDLRISGLGGMNTIGRLQGHRPVPAVVVLAGAGAIYLRHAAAAEGAAGYLVASEDLDHLGDRLVELTGSNPSLSQPA